MKMLRVCKDYAYIHVMQLEDMVSLIETCATKTNIAYLVQVQTNATIQFQIFNMAKDTPI